MLKGGGTAFGPHPRDFSTKLPRKVREMGMRVALSVKLRENLLEVVPSLQWPTPKTNKLWKKLRSIRWSDKTLFLVGGHAIPHGLRLATRNLQGVDVLLAKDLTVYEALRRKRLILDLDAVGYFAEWLAKEGDALEDTSAEVYVDLRAIAKPLPKVASPLVTPDTPRGAPKILLKASISEVQLQSQ